MKFKALIPFAYENKVFDMKSVKPYEEDEKLVSAWADAGYCKIVEDEKETPAETDENTPDNDEKPLEELDYNELKKRAKAAGIPKYNSMKTEDLIKSLRGE